MTRHAAAIARLLATAAAVAAAPALAQADAPATPSTGVTDPAATGSGDAADKEIVVTGIRRANAAAIAAKRGATNIVDVVSATDVRALPDATIVEALRRVPGLSVLPATDNEHPRDEAATPVLRGLGPSYNNVTIDGLTIASPGTPNGTLGSITRGVRLDILPSSMVSEIQVVKTFTPDLDPNATGGAVNLRTRSAFEQGGATFLTVEGSLGHASDNGKPRDQNDPGGRVIATASATFGAAHQFGATLSANYQSLASYTETHMTTDTVHYGFYDGTGLLLGGNALGNGRAVPQQDKYWYVMDARSRVGVTAKFEARAADRLDLFATGGYYEFRDDMERNELIVDPRDRTRVYDQTATSGRYPKGDVEVGYAHHITTTRTRVGQAGATWRPGDHQALSARVSASRATYVEPIFMVKYATNVARPGAAKPDAIGRSGVGKGANPVQTAEYGFTYDTSARDQRFPITAAAYEDVGNYSLLYWRPARDYLRAASDRVATARLDYAINQGRDDRGPGLAVGASYSDDRPRYAIDRSEFAPNVRAPRLAMADVLGPSNAPMEGLALNMFAIDPRRARRQVEAAPPSAYNATDQSTYNNQDDFEHRERLGGGYAMATLREDIVHLVTGLRYDEVRQETVGRRRQLERASGSYVYVPDATRSSYREWLPSSLLTVHATPALDLRAAASRTLGRPPYDAYAARTSTTFVSTADQGNAAADGVSVTIGNPEVRPRVSRNLDLAADYRVDAVDGLVSLALFDKKIRDEIFTLTRIGAFTFDGTTYTHAAISTPANAAAARIRGAEASVVINSLRALAAPLAGIGLSTNLALLDGRLTVPFSPTPGTTSSRAVDRLVGQPSYTANATLFYAADAVELRAALNRQGRALRALVSNIAWQDLYWAPRSQVDLSASYRLSPAASLIAQVGNLTHRGITTLTGPGVNLLKDRYSMPTSFWVGLRLTPTR
ncbi:TonB-dependent receptor [Sphingomonas sp. RHCKR7]|uniref:TonB-dependent receptor n=1 Tax=Sphingomonas folli TaxID=2862497 RepID=UPI001CA4DD10|nr:TonB-dependent receptor [Sphingomonas folli]MBW6527599.1 TonB-dependent receptor [Sphingomonas folli]